MAARLTAMLLVTLTISTTADKPHIIFILADDLGWNDVGFHGSNQIPTPNIDALAYTGIILNNYYVTPVCTPSRSALMTGKYPIHTGLQHGVIHGSTPYGLPLSHVLLPELLQREGYRTRAVGKWHLGSHYKEYTPCFRGFDSHYGYWVGHQDYYDHTSQENLGYWGYDLRRGMDIAWDDYGKYSTDLFTEEALKIIGNHDKEKPLFLYLAHLATHSANPYRPLQAPAERVAQFNYIKDINRRLFAGMLSKMDDSVGAIVAALSDADMLNNSIIIFSTDNGGPADGFNSNAASNFPLRGVKDTLWEGGVRGAAFIWSALLKGGWVSHTLMHITDWLPTLLEAVRGINTTTKALDGVSVWKSLTTNSSAREEVLLNIDHQRKIAGLLIGPWKLIVGHTWNGSWDGWYGPSGRENTYNWTSLFSCPTAVALNKLRPLPDQETIQRIRTDATVQCENHPNTTADSANVYLFNVEDDPCEFNNLVDEEVQVLDWMLKRLEAYNRTVVPPRNKPADPRSNPKFWGYAWVNWMDYLQ